MSNNTSTQKTTFWKFLENHTIEIPIIQRDYAQGRKGKEELRKTFLGNLKTALDNNSTLTLDFVYGSKENNRLNPLDGQQRLTTLWLLHWYVAYKAGKLTDKGVSNTFKKFTYETRVSSREFCEHLAEFNTPKGDFEGTISDFIQQQTWFYSAWKQDPTIQSMLRMLSGTPNKDKNGQEIIDGLEELFKPDEIFEKYWNILTEQDINKCPISFYNLDLGELKLTDDLYIKMNARGEQLTSFENFKADLIGYVREQQKETEDTAKEQWEKLLSPTEGIPIKMDTTWTDIFWKNKTDDGKIDDIYFAFLNRFFFNELFIAKTAEQYILNTDQENENKTYKYLNDDFKIAYSGLDIYKFYDGSIPIEFFKKLQTIFYRYAKYNNTIPECNWDNNFTFIPKYEEPENGEVIEIENNAGVKIKKITTLNQVQRIVFFAVCKYFSEEKNSDDNEISLKRWIRVVWNLVSGEDNSGRPQIRSTSAMRTAIEFISKLDSHNVYASLLNDDNIKNLKDSDFDLRCKEEIEKVKQILDNNNIRKYSGNIQEFKNKTWEDVIITTENYAFFKGSIRFLFHNDKGDFEWSNFDEKWARVQMYFDETGIQEDYKVAITKDLVIQCTDWNNQLYDKQIFNTNAPTWKWILCANNWILPIHNILMADNLDSIVKTESMNDDNVNNKILPIIENIPFKEIINKIPEGRFRWNNRLAIYKPYGHDAIVFDWDKWQRNAILSEAVNNNKITTDQKIDDCDFFWGWNIQFTYNNGTDYHFEWNTDGNIYLMDDKWNRIKKDNEDIKIDTSQITIDNLLGELDKLTPSNNPSQTDIEKTEV